MVAILNGMPKEWDHLRAIYVGPAALTPTPMPATSSASHLSGSRRLRHRRCGNPGACESSRIPSSKQSLSAQISLFDIVCSSLKPAPVPDSTCSRPSCSRAIAASRRGCQRSAFRNLPRAPPQFGRPSAKAVRFFPWKKAQRIPTITPIPHCESESTKIRAKVIV